MSYPEMVGDISYDPKTDNPDFVLCNNKRIYQYYSVKTNYEGEKVSLYKEIQTKYKFKNSFRHETGFITIRFVVSCNGFTDRFRIFEIDEHYLPKKFNAELRTQLLDICKSLKHWKPGLINGQAVDSYYHLSFKLQDGKIISIKP